MRWIPFVYQYVIAWIIMGVGLYLAVKSKNINLETAYGKKYFIILIGGLAGMIGASGIFAICCTCNLMIPEPMNREE